MSTHQFTVEDQVAIIYAGSKNLLRSVPVAKVKDFEISYLEHLKKNHLEVLSQLKQGKLTDTVVQTLESVCKDLSDKY